MGISTIQSNENSVYQPLEGVSRKETEGPSQINEQPQQAASEKGNEYLPDDPVGAPVKGIYSVGHDAEGNTTVHYIDPHASEAKSALSPASEAPVSGVAPEKSSSTTTTNTDRVDGEIRRLKEQQQLIQQKLRAELDEEKKAELQSQLQQISIQLSQKDNDFYRRQNAVVL